MTVQIIYMSPPPTSGDDFQKSLGPINPLNPLSRRTRLYLHSELMRAIGQSDVSSIILFGGTNFSAGADINEFVSSSESNILSDSDTTPSLIDICNLIESSQKPVVAVLTGITFGGGFEIALSCHFRIALDTVQLALPEVKIGLIPGAGGTQRLPRITANVKWSLDLITSGRVVSAMEARKYSVLDDVFTSLLSVEHHQPTEKEVQQQLIDKAMKWVVFAESMGDLTFRRARCKKVIHNDSQALLFARSECDTVAKKLPRREMGGLAAHCAVESIRASFEEELFEDGMNVEKALFLNLLHNSAQGRGLRHAFFAERLARKDVLPCGPMALRGVVADTLLRHCDRALVGVIGAGLMGSGIAISFLRAGYQVVLIDNNAESLKKGLLVIHNTINGDVAKKRLSESRASAIIKGCLHASTNMTSSRLKECILVVEAVFENLALKQNIFRQLDDIITSPSALIVTNTSTLDVDKISNMLRPERRPYCAGMHFFSPAHIMKLVEIVRGSQSSPETLAIIQEITNKNLKKVGVLVGNCEGFVGNRMLHPYIDEAVLVLHERGASVFDLDCALVEFGMALGPMQMGDLAGNDIGYLIRKEKGLVKDPSTGLPGPNRTSKLRYSDLADDLVTKLGRKGQKVMKGWYDYDKNVGGGRQPMPSEEVTSFIRSNCDVPTVSLSKLEIVERVLFPLVNEGFKVLEEGYARTPDDIDVIYIFGYGFPAWRGGPMFWADNEIGLGKLLRKLEHFYSCFPGSDYFKPSRLLKQCVDMNLKVKEYYDKGYHKQRNSKL